ncbi:hypothetical protein E2C01_065431 [Portunus trituberculatus]|uniref:Uncharacterized protein n=1 Tax=Portunus trituberculatus TaxID=210409 RepID=A0A5B7HEK1_PORTR|nr:hypothetical protein [Portunus trituberculatus]
MGFDSLHTKINKKACECLIRVSGDPLSEKHRCLQQVGRSGGRGSPAPVITSTPLPATLRKTSTSTCLRGKYSASSTTPSISPGRPSLRGLTAEATAAPTAAAAAAAGT